MLEAWRISLDNLDGHIPDGLDEHAPQVTFGAVLLVVFNRRPPDGGVVIDIVEISVAERTADSNREELTQQIKDGEALLSNDLGDVFLQDFPVRPRFEAGAGFRDKVLRCLIRLGLAGIGKNGEQVLKQAERFRPIASPARCTANSPSLAGIRKRMGTSTHFFALATSRTASLGGTAKATSARSRCTNPFSVSGIAHAIETICSCWVSDADGARREAVRE